MKYDVQIIITLITLFFLSQLVGLSILYNDAHVQVVNGTTEVVHSETVIGPRPEFQGPETFLWVISSVFITTGLVLLIVRFQKINWMKLLFFSATFLTVAIALGVFIDPTLAYVIALLLAIIKVFKPNKYLHNIIEMLTYAGLVLILAPLFDITWIVALLIVISAYDIFAVWRSKHMIKMAKFQIKGGIFTGLFIPLSDVKKKVKGIKTGVEIKKRVKVREAIMGGGDVAFPMLFTGVVMESLIKMGTITKELAFLKVLIIPIVVSLVLLYLFVKGQQGKYYPGMPFITFGCLVGYLLVLII
jgi:presenilin-like A22 family membrane protease